MSNWDLERERKAEVTDLEENVAFQQRVKFGGRAGAARVRLGHTTEEEDPGGRSTLAAVRAGEN